MKKLLAILLSLCTVLSLSVPAFAAEAEDATNPDAIVVIDESEIEYVEEEHHGVCTACQNYFREYWEMMAREEPDEIEEIAPVETIGGEELTATETGESGKLILVETGNNDVELVETTADVSEILLDVPAEDTDTPAEETTDPAEEIGTGDTEGCTPVNEPVPVEPPAFVTDEPSDPSFVVTQKVRLVGDTAWGTSVNAKVGDFVEFQLMYKNTESDLRIHENVTVQAILPANLKYEGSATIYNTKWVNGCIMDESITDGICIGIYDRGANAYVRFVAEVVDENLEYGKNTLANWMQATVGQTVVSDSATVNVIKKDVDPNEPSDGPIFSDEPIVGGGYWNPSWHDGWAYGQDGNRAWMCDVNSFLSEHPALREAAGTYFQRRGINVDIEVSADYYSAKMTGSNGRTVTVYNWHCNSDLQPGNFELISGTDNDGNHILLTVYSEESLYRISTGSGDAFYLWAIRPQAEELCERLGLKSFVFCFETRGRLVSNVLAWLVKSPDGDYVVRMAR